jgi:hypothetical protein
MLSAVQQCSGSVVLVCNSKVHGKISPHLKSLHCYKMEPLVCDADLLNVDLWVHRLNTAD